MVAKNESQFALPARITFRHLYFSPDKRGAAARDAAVKALEQIGQNGDTTQTARLGDQFMFQDYYADRTIEQVANVMGSKFAQALLQLKPGVWSGPVESGFGWHLVWVDSITPSRVPEFDEVDLADIKTQWLSAQRAETKRKLFTAMRARYEIVLPKPFSAPSTFGIARRGAGPGDSRQLMSRLGQFFILLAVVGFGQAARLTSHVRLISKLTRPLQDVTMSSGARRSTPACDSRSY